jgi:hypothetical protein
VDVADVRQTFYNANSLSNLFTNVAGDTILQFLKEIDLYFALYPLFSIVNCSFILLSISSFFGTHGQSRKLGQAFSKKNILEQPL